MNLEKATRVLFVCSGNSCRSQMAEGWARHLGGGRVEAMSAGIEAHGKNPRTISIMKEVGVDISHQESTQLTPEMIQEADIIVTVCGHADEHCPVIPAGTHKEHWPLDDPARAKGSEEAILGVFRQTRDQVRERVEDLFARIRSEGISK